MKPIKYYLLSLLLACAAYASAQSICLVDSVSGGEFVVALPAQYIHSDQNAHLSLRLSNGNEFYIYSYKHPQGGTYNWSQLVDGELKRLDYLIGQERVSIKGVDGWTRRYERPGQDGNAIYEMVTTLRGNDCVVYLEEFSTTPDHWQTQAILEASRLPHYTVRDGRPGVLVYLLLLVLVFACFAFPGMKDMSAVARWALCLGAGAILFLALWIFTGYSYVFMTAGSVLLVIVWSMYCFLGEDISIKTIFSTILDSIFG